MKVRIPWLKSSKLIWNDYQITKIIWIPFNEISKLISIVLRYSESDMIWLSKRLWQSLKFKKTFFQSLHMLSNQQTNKRKRPYADKYQEKIKKIFKLTTHLTRKKPVNSKFFAQIVSVCKTIHLEFSILSNIFENSKHKKICNRSRHFFTHQAMTKRRKYPQASRPG